MGQITLDFNELQTGHYTSLLHAVGVALTRAKAWTQNGESVEATELLRYARYQGEVEAPGFYMVSAEGAIGLSSGKEYETSWVYLPAVEEALNSRIQQEQERLQQAAAAERARQEAEAEQARQEAEAAAAAERARQEAEAAAAAERARQEAEAAAAASAPVTRVARFCPNCGAPYRSETSKFCSACGTPRK